MLIQAFQLLSLIFCFTLIRKSTSACDPTCHCATLSSVCYACQTAGYYVNVAQTACVAACSTIPAYTPAVVAMCLTDCWVQEGSYLNNAKTACVNACADDETLLTAAHYCGKCWDATGDNVGKPNCVRCASAPDKTTSYCTQCWTGTYLTQTGTCPGADCSTTCTNICAASFYINLSGTACVIDCYSDNTGSYIPKVGLKCVSACQSNEYITKSKKCERCSTLSSQCTKCNQTNCLQCQTGYLLVGTKCTSTKYDCSGSNTASVFYYMNNAQTKCVNKCTQEDSGSYLSIDEKKCVTVCATSQEWIDQTDSNNMKCKKCSQVPGFTDTIGINQNHGICQTCTPDGTKCLTCLVGYLRSDEKECVLDCTRERSKKYLNQAKLKCVSDCKADDSNSYLATKGYCASACQSNEYSGTDLICHLCPKSCSACTTAILCTTCKNGYLNFAKSACVSDCFTEDSGRMINYDNKSCVSTCGTYKQSIYNKKCIGDCEADEFYGTIITGTTKCLKCKWAQESDVFGAANKKCDPSAIIHCVECATDTLCAECDNGKVIVSNTGGTIGKCVCNSLYYKDLYGYCQLCTDLYGARCLECTEQKCLSCSSVGTTYYYAQNGICTLILLPYCTQMSINGICKACSNGAVVIDGTTRGTCECLDGFYKDYDTGSCAKTCIPDTILITDCIKCKTSSTTCTLCTGSTPPITDSGPLGKCNCGLYMYKSGSICMPCNGGVVDQWCEECSSDTVCTKCKNGYGLTAATTCIACTATNCKVCTPGTESTCVTCNAGYVLDGSSLCVTELATYAINTNSFECRGRFDSDCATCTILLCVSCTSTTAVISLAGTAGTINIGYCSCPIGSFKNTNKCDTCPTGCTACTAATTCQACSSGYYLDTLCKLPAQATDATTCLNYGFGLYAYSASCTACGSHKASSTGATCDKCEDYYYLVGTNCVSNPILNCKTYNVPTAQECSVCKTGYDLSSDKKCKKCFAANCVTCTAGNATKCTVCASGYGLSADLCIACPTGCNQCNLDVTQCDAAINCADGKIITGTKLCVCDANYVKLVKATETDSRCITCQEAIDSKCVECSGYACTKCTEDGKTNGKEIPVISAGTYKGFCTCPSKQYLKTATGECTACTAAGANCLTCPDDKCTQCESTYFVRSDACTLCSDGTNGIANCEQCQIKYDSLGVANGIICTLCKNAANIFFTPNVDNNDCTAFTAPTYCPAAHAFSQKHCKSCKSIFDATKRNVTGSFWLCDCLAAEYRDSTSGDCTANPANGLICTGAAACTSCASKFYGGDCTLSCLADCDKCSGPATCLSCLAGDLILSNNTCTCAGGYFKEKGHCYPCNLRVAECTSCSYDESLLQFSCITCSTGIVVTSTQDLGKCVCSSAFFKSTDQCTACSSHCITCSSGSVCTACENGYRVDSTNACIESKTRYCKTYESDTSSVCTACINEYYLVPTILKCVKTIDFCLTYSSETTCTSCLPGYTIQSFRCQPAGYYMKYCQKCSGATVCTTCMQGYYMRADKVGCVSDCQLDLSSSAKNYLNKAGTFCVSNCYTDDSGYINLEQLQCVNECALDEYIYTSGTQKYCKLCSVTYQPGCTTCDASWCLSCDPAFGYLLLTNASCSWTCAGGSYINTDKTACVSSCTYYSVDLKSCKSSCTPNIEINQVGFCKLCREVVALNLCAECSSLTVCTKCLPGYYLPDSGATSQNCVLACSTADSRNKYYSKDNTSCVVSCSPSLLSREGTFCVEACDYDEYISTNQCELCSLATGLSGCKTCEYVLSILKCTLCLPGYYLTSTNTCSIYHCSSSYLSKDGITCVNSCSVESSYIMSGEIKKCTNDCWNNDGNTYVLDVNGDGSEYKCVAKCITGKYADSTTHTCKSCSLAMTDCLECTTISACTKCATGKILNKDANGCVQLCSQLGTYTNVAKTQCVATCLGAGSVLSTDGINCLSTCLVDEFAVAGVCSKCGSFTSMDYCYTCTSTIMCTKCTSGYVKLNGLGCTGDCTATTEWIDVTGVKCVSSCGINFPSSMKAKPQCVKNCKADDGSVLDVSNPLVDSKCINISVCNAAATTYVDFNQELCLACSKYSAALKTCSTCSSDGTKVTCTACTSGYLQSDGSACLLTCKIAGEYLSGAVCVTTCPNIVDTDRLTCIVVGDCDTSGNTEFIESGFCYKCNEFPTISTYPWMVQCATCTAKDVCLTCSNSYLLRADAKGCVRDCSVDDSNSVKNYLAVGGGKCQTNCSTDYIDARTVEPSHATACVAVATCLFLDSTSTYCLTACPEGQTENGDKVCKVYLTGCKTYSDATHCSGCFSGYLISTDFTKCTTNCAGEAVSSDGTLCISTAADGATANQKYYTSLAKTQCTDECDILVGKTQFANAQFVCQLCAAGSANCLKCDSSAAGAVTQCHKCVTNWYVDGAVCANNCAGKFINQAVERCVTSCWKQDNKRFQNVAGDRCINSCSNNNQVIVRQPTTGAFIDYKCAATCPAVDNSYYYRTVTHYLGNVEKFCELCSTILFQCKKCSLDGITCLTCNTNFALNQDPTKGCLSICEPGYVIISATNKCTLCSSDNNKIVSRDLTTCITSCPTTEFKNTTINTCNLCENSIAYCSTCSSGTVCTLCKTISSVVYKLSKDTLRCVKDCYDFDTQAYYYQIDASNHRCVATCSSLGYYPSAMTPYKCISKCSDESTFLNTAGTACIKVCPTGYYGKVSTGNCTVCIVSATAFEKCSACYETLNVKYCYTCIDSYFLRADKIGCIQTCSSITSSYLSLFGDKCVDTCLPEHINNAGTQCIEACADTEYADQNNKCITCSTKITSCQKCTMQVDYSVLCTLCSSGYLSIDKKQCGASCSTGYISCDTKRCVADCYKDDSSAYLDGINCVQACTGKYISVDQKLCVTACGANEYNDSTVCKLCTSDIAGCAICSKDSGALLCSKCSDNLWLALDFLSCNHGCLGTDKLALNYATCTQNCKCVLKCSTYASPVAYLNLDGTACVSACQSTEYSDPTDVNQKQCKTCSVPSAPWGITNCIACSVNGGSNAIICSQCKSGYYLKSDGSACATSCQGFSEMQVPTSYTCLTACPNSAVSGYYILCADGYTCRLASSGCLTGEYLDGLLCKYCNSGNGFTNCAACTITTCTTCKTNYYLNANSVKVCLSKCSDSALVKSATLPKCITNCKNDDSSYLSVDLQNCVAACSNLGPEFKTSIAKDKCLYPFESCGDVAYFADLDSSYKCILCNTALVNCLACTSRTVCTSCVDGTKLNVVDSSSAYCVASCATGYKLKNSDSTTCIQNCSTNADTNLIENSAQTCCVSTCEADEWINPSGYSLTAVALKSFKQCVKCADIGGAMQFCDRCSGTTKLSSAASSITAICTRCITGYLRIDRKGCVVTCDADTSVSVSGGAYLAITANTQKFCVEDCLRDNDPNVPLTSVKKCVVPSNCKGDGEFLAVTLDKCIPQCLAEQYVDSDKNACKYCKYANSNNPAMTYCKQCYYSSASSQVLCTQCSAHYLKVDQLGCISSCRLDGQPSYSKYQADVTKNTNKCVASCYTNDYEHKGQSVDYTCVTACVSGQYEDAHICYDCTRRYYLHHDQYYEKCLTCTNVDVCTSCSTYYYRKDNKGCISDCNNETEYDAHVNYDLGGQKKCVVTCKSQSVYLQISGDDYDCVTACTPNTQYIEETNTENYCRVCSFTKFSNPSILNCSQCTGANKCTLCYQLSTSPYLKSDGSGCLTSCPAEEFLALATLDKACLVQCPYNQYNNEASGSPKQCLLCSDAYANCLTCDSSGCKSCSSSTLYLKLDKSQCVANCQSDSGHYLSKNKKNCVAACSTGYYVDNYVCKACSLILTNCYSCQSATICTQCSTGYFVDADNANSCVSQCPSKQIPNYQTYKCVYCVDVITKCEQCAYDSSSTAICSKCQGGYYLYQIENKCYQTCPTPLFNVPSSLNYNKGNLCLQYCPYGSAQIINQYLCDTCHESCASCSVVNDKNYCLTCATDYYKSEKLCVKCSKGYYLSVVSSKCVKTCDQGYYGESSLRQCNVCNSACKNCKGPNIDDCTECSSLRLINGMCAEITTAACPSDQYTYYTQYETKCVQECPSGFYKNSSTKSCEQCDSSCKTCEGGDSYSCISCGAGKLYYVDKKSCVAYCPTGSFLNNDKNCESCDSKCVECKVSSTYCSYCKNGYYLFDYQCISTCPSGTFKNTLNNKCTECDGSCVQCTNYTSLNCTKCDQNNGYTLQRELDMEEGQCRKKTQIIKEIEASLDLTTTYNTAYEIKVQSEKIKDALFYQQTVSQQTVAKKSVESFTDQATKLSKVITTSSDAFNIVAGYSELSAIAFSSTDKTLENGLEILSNVQTRTALTADVYSESVSAMSNCISRKIDLFNTKDTTDTTLKTYSKSFFTSVSSTLNSYTEKIQNNLFSNYISAQIITSINSRLSISFKTVEITTNSVALFQVGSSSSSQRRMLETVYNNITDCKVIDSPASASVTVPEVLVLSMPSSQGYLIKYINSYINTFDNYNNSENIKSNVVTYEIFDNLTTTLYDIKGFEINIEIPLNENRCKDYLKYKCKLWDSINKKWTSNDIEYVKEAQGVVECKLRKLGSVAIFEYDPNEFSRSISENYGIYASFILALSGVIVVIIAIQVNKEKDNLVKVHSQQQQIITPTAQNEEQATSLLLQICLTVSPIYSIFYSKNKFVICLKTLLLLCYFITIFMFLAIYLNHKEFIDFDITQREGLIIPAAILAIIFSWVVKYILGSVKLHVVTKQKSGGIIALFILAILYYCFCGGITTWRMSESDDEISKLWILGIFIGMLLDLFIFDIIIIGISHGFSLPKSTQMWSILQHNGFTESLQEKQHPTLVQDNNDPENVSSSSDKDNHTQQVLVQEVQAPSNKIIVDEEEEQELDLRTPGVKDQLKFSQPKQEKEKQKIDDEDDKSESESGSESGDDDDDDDKDD